MENVTPQQTEKQGMGAGKIVAIVLATVVLSVGLSVWAVNAFLFPNEFKPVELDSAEQAVLDAKLQRTRRDSRTANTNTRAEGATLTPEPYSESGASREISFSERELNAMLAHNTDLAQRLAIDLADDLASAKLLVPLDPDFPILGGKTLKVTAGVSLAFAKQRPVVILKGVSVWGVPLPAAWLGGMKNIDLIREFGDDGGFWQAFVEGVENIAVKEGQLYIKLRE